MYPSVVNESERHDKWPNNSSSYCSISFNAIFSLCIVCHASVKSLIRLKYPCPFCNPNFPNLDITYNTSLFWSKISNWRYFALISPRSFWQNASKVPINIAPTIFSDNPNLCNASATLRLIDSAAFSVNVNAIILSGASPLDIK